MKDERGGRGETARPFLSGESGELKSLAIHAEIMQGAVAYLPDLPV
jgi:hypothetical protein